ncbi:MAG TPA: CARDB domain-containing protein, partial [Chloroflexota bacterium]
MTTTATATVTATIAQTPLALPDLFVPAVSPLSGPPSQPILVDIVVQNIGAGPVTSNFNAQVFADLNHDPVPGEPPLQTVSVAPLAAGASTTVQAALAPGILATGVHNLRVLADGANSVIETNERNNVGGGWLAVGGPPQSDSFAGAPLLDVNGFGGGDTRTATSETGEPVPTCAAWWWNGTRTVWYRIEPATSGTLSVELLIAGEADLALYTGTTLAGLHQAACITEVNSTVTTPVTAGERYFLQVRSAADQGSSFVVRSRLDTSVQPDLIVSELLVTDQWTTGHAMPFETTVQNSGNGATGVASKVSVYADTPSTPGAGDTPLLTLDVPPLAAAGTAMVSGSLPPNTLTAGEHTVWAVADSSNVVAESNETNNATANGTFVGQTPANDDFANAASLATSTTVVGTLNFASRQPSEPQPNCGSTQFNSPTVWYQLAPAVGDVSVSASFNDSHYFSPTLSVYTGSAVNQLQRVACARAANFASGGTSTLTMPLLSGQTYYLQVVGFGPEFTLSTSLAPARADLEVSFASALPASSEQQTDVSIQIRNRGSADASVVSRVGLYVDLGRNPTTADTPIASASVPPIVSGAVASVTATVPANTMSPGFHTIFILADATGVVDESNETNNAASVSANVLLPVLISGRVVTPSGTGVSGVRVTGVCLTLCQADTSPLTGPNGDFVWRVSHARVAMYVGGFQGYNSTRAVVVDASASSNIANVVIGAAPSSSTVSGTVRSGSPTGPVVPNPFVSVSIPFEGVPGSVSISFVGGNSAGEYSVPLAPGTYDFTVSANFHSPANRAVTVPASNTVEDFVLDLPDLAPFLGGISPVTEDRPLPIALTVVNQGLTATTISSAVNVYIDLANAPTSSDTPIATLTVPPLPGGGSNNPSLVLAANTVRPGPHVLWIVVDAANVIAESNEANNVTSRAFSVAPANDAFGFARAVALPSATAGTGLGATLESFESSVPCGQAVQWSVWYRLPISTFTPARLSVSTSSSQTPVLSVYTGFDLAHLTALACATSGQLMTNISPGTYYVQVAGPAAAAGDFTLRINGRPDLFISQFSNVHGAVDQPLQLTATVANQGNGDMDTNVQVGFYVDPTSPPSPVNGTPVITVEMPPLAIGGSTTVSATLSAGTLTQGAHTVWVLADSTGAAAETDEANNTASVTAIIGPANDRLSGALPLAVGTRVSANTLGASLETDEPAPSCSFENSGSIWYRLTAPSSGLLQTHVASETRFHYLALYRSPVAQPIFADLFEIGCANSPSFAALDVGVEAGQTYFLQVISTSGGGPISFDVALDTNQSPPANDSFQQAVSLTLPGFASGSNVSATRQSGEPTDPCSGTARIDNTVWYRITPSSSGVLTTSVTASFAVNVAVYSGSDLGSLARLGCDIGFGGQPFDLSLAVAAGETYYIQVSGRANNRGTYSLQVSLDTGAARPVNDAFANARSLSVPDAVTDSNTAATLESGEPRPTCATSTQHTVWYRFQPATTGSVAVALSSSAFSPVGALYSGLDIAHLTSLACQVNGFDALVTAGQTYYIQVGASTDVAGPFQLTIDPAPVNDALAEATVIDPPAIVLTGTTVGATLQPSEPTPTCGQGNDWSRARSVWYRWTPLANGLLTVSAGSPVYSPFVTAYVSTNASVTTASLAEIGCGTSGLSIGVMAAQTYYLQVVSPTGASGAFTLHLDLDGMQIAQANDMLANAALLPVPGSVSTSNQVASKEPNEPSSCPFGMSKTLWYRLPAGTSGRVTLVATGQTFTPLLGVYNALPSSSNTHPLACGSGRVDITVSPSDTIYVQVGGSLGQSGPLSLQSYAPPANDNFANATPIALPFTEAGSTVAATAESGEPQVCDFSGGARSVWYRIVPAQSGQLTATTAGSALDMVLEIYRAGSPDTLANLAFNGCNMNFNSGSLTSSLTSGVQAGQTYYLRLTGRSGTSGAFILNVTNDTTQPPPANDEFADAQSLNLPVVLSGTLHGATVQPREPSTICRGQLLRTVWYAFTPATSGLLVATTSGSATHPILALYASPTPAAPTVSTLSTIGCNDGYSEPNQTTRLEVGVYAGQMYYLQFGDEFSATADAFRVDISIDATLPPPVNDAVAGALPLPIPGAVTTSIRSASLELGEPPNCGGGYHHTIWYTFTPTQSGSITLVASSSTFHPLMQILTGTPGNQSLFTCRVDETTFSVTAGTTYYVALNGTGDLTGSVTLQSSLPPTNDAFSGATDLSIPAHIIGSTLSATVEPGEPGPICARSWNTFPGPRSVWYHVSPSTAGLLTLSTAGSSYDTVLALYTGSSLSNLTVVDCNDEQSSSVHTSQLQVYLTPGTTYYLQVTGSAAQRGAFVLDATLDTTVVPPENDAFDAAQAITADPARVASIAGTTFAATRQAAEPNGCTFGLNNTVWYRVSVPGPGTLVIGGTSRAVLALFDVPTGSPSLSGLHLVNCGISTITTTTTGAHDYYLQVADSAGSSGSFLLDVAFDVVAANDAFANASPLTLPSTIQGNTSIATVESGEVTAPSCVANANRFTRTVWYQVTPATSGPLTITTGATWGPVAVVYRGTSLFQLTELRCATASEFSTDVTSGQTYYIQIGGAAGQGGAFTLHAELSGAPEAPTTPAPADQAANVRIDTQFTWQASTHATSYDLRIWADGQPRPSVPAASGLTQASFTPLSPLPTNTLFHWDVVARNSFGTTTGPVWSFTTERLPNLVLESVTVSTPAFAGEAVRVSWTVRNRGDAPTTAGARADEVFLSPGTTFDSAHATLLGSMPLAAAVLPGDSYQLELSPTLPERLSGTFVIAVSAGVGGRETNLGDNLLASAPFPIELDTTPPPAPVITLPGAPVTTNLPTIVVHGTAEAGARVRAWRDDNFNGARDSGEPVSGDAQLAPLETSFSLAAMLVQNAPNQYIVTATDHAGNESAAVVTTTIVHDSIPPTISSAVVEPTSISPNGDGRGDQAVIRYTLSEQALVVLNVHNAAGQLVRALRESELQTTGAQAVTWNGQNDAGQVVADGPYSLRINAMDLAGNFAQQVNGSIVVDTVAPSLTNLTFDPPTFSPNSDGVQDTTQLSYQLSESAAITVRIDEATGITRRVLVSSAARSAGLQAEQWNGRDDTGAVLPDGFYTFHVIGTDAAANSTEQTASVRIVSTALLTFESTDPPSGTAFTVTPADVDGATSGTTTFTRRYPVGTSVTVTAPSSSSVGATFLKWRRDGADLGTALTVTVVADADHTLQAIYAFPDLSVTRLAATGRIADEPVRIVADLSNSAPVATSSSTRAYVIVDPSATPPTAAELPLMLVDVPAMAAGGTTTVNLSVPGSALAAGSHTLWLLLNANGAVAEPNTANNSASVHVDLFQRPSNDAFASAPAMTLPFTQNGDTRGASVETGEPVASCASAEHTVWYSVTPGSSGTLNVGLTTLSSGVQPALAVFTGATLNGLVEQACAAQVGSASPTLHVSVLAGQQLYVRVGARAAASGTFAIQASLDVDAIAGVVHSTSGASIAGAVVTAESATSNLTRSVTASSDGSFTLRNLPAGVYRVKSGAVGFSTEYYAGANSTLDPALASLVVVSSDALAMGVDTVLHAVGSIAGTTRDTNGQLLADVSVSAVRLQCCASTNATSIAGGTYELANLPPGEYRVWFMRTGSAPQYYTPTGPVTNPNLAVAVVVAEGGHTIGIDITMPPNGTVTGTVVDTNGAPVSGVVVTLSSLADVNVSLQATSDSVGRVRFDDVPPGTWNVAGGASPALVPPPGGPIQVQPGAVSAFQMVYLRAAHVSGLVRDDRGGVRANVTITAFSANHTAVASTSGSDGTYELFLAPDTWTLGPSALPGFTSPTQR